MSELLSCLMCPYFAACEEQLLRHVCQIHEHDPQFSSTAAHTVSLLPSWSLSENTSLIPGSVPAK